MYLYTCMYVCMYVCMYGDDVMMNSVLAEMERKNNVSVYMYVCMYARGNGT